VILGVECEVNGIVDGGVDIGRRINQAGGSSDCHVPDGGTSSQGEQGNNGNSGGLEKHDENCEKKR